MARRLILIAGALAACMAPALGAELPEPNRPWSAVPGLEGGEADGQEPALELQMVILPRQGKPAAVINGERVVLGGRYGDAVLVAVREDRAILLGPMGRKELRLTPDMKTKPARPGEGDKVKQDHTKGKKRDTP